MTKARKGWATYLISFMVSYTVGWWIRGVISKQLHRRGW